jgi:hypothetical protein
MHGFILRRRKERLQTPMMTMLVAAYRGGLDKETRVAGARHVLLNKVRLPRRLAKFEMAHVEPQPTTDIFGESGRDV